MQVTKVGKSLLESGVNGVAGKGGLLMTKASFLVQVH